MGELQARKESLLEQLATADAPVALLHPNLAALYREKVAKLASASESPQFLMVVDPPVNHGSRWTASSLPHRA